MLRVNEIKLPIDHPPQALEAALRARLGLEGAELVRFEVAKRAHDARRKTTILMVYNVDVEVTDEAAVLKRCKDDPKIGPTPDTRYRPVAQAPADLAERPLVIGAGPCGLFAGLILAEMGFKPIILERGKVVRERTKDTWGLWRRSELNPESNVQFGEGGAGTFSDGKLYSQIRDPRHLGRKVMEEFVAAGAPSEILYVAHPHIGTFKLVKVVEAMREKIIELGGEIRFQQRVAEVLLEPATGGAAPEGFQPRRVRGLKVQDLASGEITELTACRVVLALGHSSRDTFTMLHDAGVFLEPKPFSIGVRIEHPQSVIDQSLWGRHAGHPLLGAAAYKLVHHADNGRAVYSFCMCPGGTVVAATSEPDRVVTNGMSQYSRAERNANAGMVVGIDPADYPTDEAAWIAAFGEADGKRYVAQAQAMQAIGQTHPLAGVVFQRQLESRAFEAGGRDYQAPGQLVGDFLAGKPSTDFGAVQPSYKPGVKLGDLSQVLPDFAVKAMRQALPAFGRKIKGYDMMDAVMTGVETRTSSPLRITRGEDFQSLNVEGLYPAGEGAGYAGGILSAGVDGIKVAEAVAVAAVGAQAA